MVVVAGLVVGVAGDHEIEADDAIVQCGTPDDAGEAPDNGAGLALASGDFDGDGATDLLVGAAYDDRAAPQSGKVYLLSGPL